MLDTTTNTLGIIDSIDELFRLGKPACGASSVRIFDGALRSFEGDERMSGIWYAWKLSSQYSAQGWPEVQALIKRDGTFAVYTQADDYGYVEPIIASA